MIMTIDIKNLRDAALRAKSAAEQYANGEISPIEFSRQCSEFNSLTDSPDQILAILDEIGGASALATLMKINVRELLKESEAKDARIAEQVETIAKQEKWIRGIEDAMIEATDRAAEWESKAISNREACVELQSRAEAADKLQDSAYRDGLKAGFSYGQTDEQAGFERCLNAYSVRGKTNG